MKIERINITIPATKNKHRPYLYNEMTELINKNYINREFKDIKFMR